jgi:lipoprotein-anchoring transpeptidase ErfK/SrfK
MRARGVLVAAICAVLTTCGDGGGVGRPVTSEVAAPTFTRPHAPADAAAVRTLALPGTLLADAEHPSLPVHWRPGTARPFMRLDATNPWRQDLRLLVLNDAFDEAGDLWLRVQLPIWPNGQQGWVSAGDIRLAVTSERIVVDLSERRLVRYRDGEVVARMRVGVGAAGTPTPPGRFVVWAKVDTGRPSGPYGSYILGLSGFSEAIDPSDWPGDPRLAIHGTDDPADAGRAVSSGCVRVPNELLDALRDVPMGTPVLIRP